MSEKIQASHGETERTRQMQGIPWAGTNLPEELLEVQQHIRQLIDAGYGYRFMESYLSQHGYGVNIIRHAFKQLTGLRAEDAVNFNWQYSPGNIPGLNLGWGHAKNGKGSYFIMPIANWYMVFHQESDMIRREESRHLTIQEAYDACKKLVKKLERWDPPVKERKTIVDVSRLYKQPHLFMNARITPLCKQLDATHSLAERKALIRQAYSMGLCDEDTRAALLNVYADDEMVETVIKDEVQREVEDVESRPIADGEYRTPQEVLDTKKVELAPAVNQGEIMDSIIKYVFEKNAMLHEFDVVIGQTVFKPVTPVGQPTASPDETDVTNTSAWVAVFLHITDKVSGHTKYGLVTFQIIDNNIDTKDVIKGLDDKHYGITDEGLSEYFTNERQRSALDDNSPSVGR